MDTSLNAPKPRARHTLSFIIVVPVILIVLYVLGAFFRPVNLTGQVNYVIRVVVQFALFTLLSVLFIFAFYTLVLRKSIGQMRSDLRSFEHETGTENLSTGFLLLGILAIAAQLVGWPTASSLSSYLYELLTKGSLGLLLATGSTVLGSALLGIRSMEHFVQYIEDPRNNQMVLVIMGLVNLAVFIAMR